MDRIETSLKADIRPPWADVPQSALGSAKSQHPPNVVHNSVPHKRYLLEALVIMHEDA